MGGIIPDALHPNRCYPTPSTKSELLSINHTMDYAYWQQLSANETTRAATLTAGKT